MRVRAFQRVNGRRVRKPVVRETDGLGAPRSGRPPGAVLMKGLGGVPPSLHAERVLPPDDPNVGVQPRAELAFHANGRGGKSRDSPLSDRDVARRYIQTPTDFVLREGVGIGGPLVRRIVRDEKQRDLRRPVNGPALVPREHPRGMNTEEEMIAIGNDAEVSAHWRAHRHTGVRRRFQAAEWPRQNLLRTTVQACDQEGCTNSRDETTPRWNRRADRTALSDAVAHD